MLPQGATFETRLRDPLEQSQNRGAYRAKFAREFQACDDVRGITLNVGLLVQQFLVECLVCIMHNAWTRKMYRNCATKRSLTTSSGQRMQSQALHRQQFSFFLFSFPVYHIMLSWHVHTHAIRVDDGSPIHHNSPETHVWIH